MPTRREIELILRELGAAQHGVAGRAQLRARGLSVPAIDQLVRVRRVSLRHRGVYQIGPLPLPGGAEHAAILACGGEARISHGTAALRHGMLRSGDYLNEVEVTMPRRRRRRLEGVRIHRIQDLRDDEVTEMHGMPVTTPARTLLDLAEVATAREVEQAYAAALRMQLVTPDSMREMLDRHPSHRGAPLWRRMLAQHDGPAFTRSEAEEKLLALTRSAGLPRPQLNVNLLGHEVDFLWRSARVVAEVDGYAFHASSRSFALDRRRDAELAAAGYRVLRFTWADLDGDRVATIVRLAQALTRSPPV
jgi:very-short-patch-repair endonuclease